MDWTAVKAWLASASLHQDALHIYLAILIQVAVAVASKRSLAHWLPWTVVLSAEVANECLDVWLGREDLIQPWQVAEGIKDILNTMLMPTVILLLVRYGPAQIWQRETDSEIESDPLDAEALGDEVAAWSGEEESTPRQEL